MRLQLVAGIVAAFLFATLVPTFIVGALAQSLDLAAIVLGIALGHAVVIGLPLFLILRRRRRVNVLTSIAAGLVAGTIPIAVFTWPFRPGSRSSSSFNNVPLVVDGVPTLAGWIAYAEGLIMPGALGALAGFVCWLVLKSSGNLATTTDAVDRRPQEEDRRNASAFSGVILIIVAAIVTGTVLAIPSIKQDRTCHNLFRDRRSVSGEWSINLQIAAEEWPSLTRQIEHFGAAHTLSLRNSSKTQPGAFPPILNLSLCNDQGINIVADNQQSAPWNFEIMSSGVVITIYNLHNDPNRLGTTRDLIAKLEAVWPGKVKILGRNIPTPKDMQGGKT
jgi:hypothetical protein